MDLRDLMPAIEDGVERMYASLKLNKPGTWVYIDYPKGSHPFRDEIMAEVLKRLQAFAPDVEFDAKFTGSQPVTLSVQIVP